MKKGIKNQFINKTVLFASLIFLCYFTQTKAQDSTKTVAHFNSTKGFGTDIGFFTHAWETRFTQSLYYKLKKLTFFSGYDFRYWHRYSDRFFASKVGIRYYPNKNDKDLKFYFTGNYSFMIKTGHGNENHTTVGYPKYWNMDFGAGIDYYFNQKISFGFETGLGWMDNIGNNGLDSHIGYTFNSFFMLRYNFFCKTTQ